MLSPKKTSTKLSKAGAVVGTIHSLESLRAASKLPAGALDFLEVRVDAFANDIATIERALPKLKIPLIVTVRDHREGGAARLGIKQRCVLYRRFLPFAKLIDIELRNARAFAGIISKARASEIGIVTSFHDFRKTPEVSRLVELAAQCCESDADILKIATVVSNARELAQLLLFLHDERRVALSVMGMGPLGKISRLLFGTCGSVLNYGYLHEPQVSGQWPALLLKIRLAELAAA